MGKNKMKDIRDELLKQIAATTREIDFLTSLNSKDESDLRYIFSKRCRRSYYIGRFNRLMRDICRPKI
jgi:hypothetical protein